MKTIEILVVAGVSLAATLAAPAADIAQLAASAGLTAAEAQGMTLSEIAAAKFNRDTGRDGQQAQGAGAGVVLADPSRHGQLIAAAGLEPSEAAGLDLGALAAGKHNAEARRDEVQVVTVSSRGPVRVGSQLLAAAGLSLAEAQGMSLTAIAAAKFNRDTRPGDYQTVGH